MRRLPFNSEWSVRPKTSSFAEQVTSTAEWSPVVLPHDAVMGTERSPDATAATGFHHGGVWEYRRELELLDEHAGQVHVLVFEGVYRTAVVRVNGQLAGRRPNGYSSFLVPIDHLLAAGTNEITVEARAGDDSRWYSGAGIHRNVWLLRAPRVHLAPEGLQVVTPDIDDDLAVVEVRTVVRNGSVSTTTVPLRVQLLDPDGTVVATEQAPVTVFPGEDQLARLRLYVPDPRRWGPDHPQLYECRATLLGGTGTDEVSDEDATTFGIRSLSLDPIRGLRINGEPVLLRGACVHHDNGVIGAAAIDRAEERRVELLEAAGFNAIRSAHNPMSKAMLDACDRLGVLVMDETFDMWTQSKSADDYATHFEDWWEADVESMVRKDINHPSVVLYCSGNEIPEIGTPAGARWGRLLAEKIRELDPTRFVTNAVSGLLAGGPELFAEMADRGEEEQAEVTEETGVNSALTSMWDRMEEIMVSPIIAEKTAEPFSPLDVAGYNYMEKRFALDRELYPNRVIVGSETVAPSIDAGWAGVVDNPHVIGDFCWTGWDYLGEAGIGRTEYDDGSSDGMAFAGGYPWLAAWCGDLDITGHRRPQSYYREIVFGLRADPYIAVQRPEHHGRKVSLSTAWSWTDAVSSWSWTGHEGAPVTVEVYADADEVELLVNGVSLGSRPVGAEHRYRATFPTTYEPGEITAVTRRGGEEVGRTVLRSASGPVSVAAEVDRSEIVADQRDLAFVEISLVDDDGVVHGTSDRRVTVEVDGPAVLQGLGSANPVVEGGFTDAQTTTFDGRALAVIRPTGTGEIVVVVRADGEDPVSVEILATAPPSAGP